MENKVKKGLLHISPSDKGKKIVAMSRDTYDKMTEPHIKGDKKTTWKELEEAQKTVRNHGRALSRVFGLGGAEGRRNRARCFNNVSSWAMEAPTLRSMAKTHKATGDNGVPKSRPIVGASKGLTTPLGELLSDLIEPVSRMNEESD